MSEIKIIYGDLRLRVTDAKTVAELEPLDRNHDGYVHYSDFDGVSQTEKETKLLGKIQTIFIPSKGDATVEKNKRDLFRRFFILYNKITSLWKASSFWYSKRTSIAGKEIEFRAKDWKEILPQISGKGEFTPDRVNAMTYELRKVLFDLTNRGTPSNVWINKRCGYQVRGLEYDPTDIRPTILQGAAKTMISRYQAVENFFDVPHEGKTSGRMTNWEMECDEGWFNTACPDEDEVSFKWTAFLDPIKSGVGTGDIRTGICESYGCFSPDTLLKTKTGTITFREMAALKAAGLALPEIASWDKVKGQEIYQRPTLLIEHSQIQSALIYLNVQESAKPLEVTPVHRMLIQRNGKQIWVHAGDLEVGDRLVGPGSNQNLIDLAASRTVEGVYTVYNLSFSSKRTGLIPTYLVSADGSHWYAAHNVK